MALEHVSAVAGYINVLPAIVIEIGDSYTHAPAFAGESRLLGNVAKFQVTLLAIEGDHGIATLAIAIYRRSVHCNDVELAVIVAVDKPHATAHGFQDVAFFGARIVGYREACFLTYIFEAGRGQRPTRSLRRARNCEENQGYDGTECAHAIRVF